MGVEQVNLYELLVNHKTLISECERYYKYGADFWGEGFINAYLEIQEENPSIPNLKVRQGEEESITYDILCFTIQEIHRRLTTFKEVEKVFLPQSVDFIKED